MASSFGLTLRNLNERARSLNNGSTISDLPSVNLSIEEIESQSRRIVNSGGGGRDKNGSYLLATAGINSEKLISTLDSINLSQAIDVAPADSVDVETLLAMDHQNSLLDAVNLAQRNSQDAFHARLATDERSAWDRLRTSFLDSDKTAQVSTAASPLRRRPAGSGPRLHLTAGPRAAHPRQAAYLSVVSELNATRRSRSSTYALAARFADACDPSERQGARIRECWVLIGGMLAENAIGRDMLAERTDPRDSPERFTPGLLAYYEAQYLQFIRGFLQRNAALARIGGTPTVENTLLGLLRVKCADLLSSPDDAGSLTWAFVYYALRTGQLQAALAFVRDRRASFGNIFSTALDAYVAGDRTLHRAQQDALKTDYEAEIKHLVPAEGAPLSLDDFKYIVYRIVGRFDATRPTHPEITSSNEDWVWLKLVSLSADYPMESFAREACEAVGEAAGVGAAAAAAAAKVKRERRDSATLTRRASGSFVKREDGSVGPVKKEDTSAAFSAPTAPPPETSAAAFSPAIFKTLLSCNEFERAIAYVLRFTETYTDGVHMAIALQYHQALRTGPAPGATLAFAVDDRWHIDFSRLLHQYSRDFPADQAAQYLYLETLASGDYGALQDDLVGLILDLKATPEAYTDLLGDIDASLRRQAPAGAHLLSRDYALSNLPSEDAFYFEIVRAAAEECRAEKRAPAAIALFLLAGRADQAVRLLNVKLGEEFVRASTAQPRPAPAPGVGILELVFAEHYEHVARAVLAARPGEFETCEQLLSLINVTELRNAGQLEDALAALESTGIVPLSPDLRDTLRGSELFPTFDATIVRHFDIVILLTMELLYGLFLSYKALPYGDASRGAKIAEVASKSRSLMTFAGVLRYRLSHETYATLTKLDIQIQ